MITQLLKGVIGQEDILRYYNASRTYIDMPHAIRGCVHYYKEMCIRDRLNSFFELIPP